MEKLYITLIQIRLIMRCKLLKLLTIKNSIYIKSIGQLNYSRYIKRYNV